MMREAVSLMGGYGITEDCPDIWATNGWTCSLKRLMKVPKRAAPSAFGNDDEGSFLASLKCGLRK